MRETIFSQTAACVFPSIGVELRWHPSRSMRCSTLTQLHVSQADHFRVSPVDSELERSSFP
eukprot:588896-Rhodomonas_salina.1